MMNKKIPLKFTDKAINMIVSKGFQGVVVGTIKIHAFTEVFWLIKSEYNKD